MKRTWTTALATLAAMLCVCAVLFGITGLPSAVAPVSKTSASPADTAQAAATATGLVSNISSNPVSTDSDAPGAVEDDLSAYEEGAILATLADGVTADEALAELNTITQLEGISLESSVSDTVVKLSLPQSVSVDEAMTLIQASDAVKTSSPNYCLYTQETLSDSDMATSTLIQTNANQNAQLIAGTALGDALGIQSVSANDPDYANGKQWSLANAGVTNAWDTVLGSHPSNRPSITVAAIDAGFDVSHDDLKDNIVAQYDVPRKTNSILPDNPKKSQYDHGTHVLGIISANTNNALGIAGVTYNTCKVLPIRIEDADGKMYVSYLLEALDYVCDNADRYNIRVVNMSIGIATYATVTRETNPQLYDAIDEAREHGIVTVAASCNAGTSGRISADSSDTKAYQPPFHAYPSDFDNVVSVMSLQENTNYASDNNVTRASSSNYNTDSQHAKDISAPGSSIYGLISSQQYASKTGTSMASPLVSGVMGLMFQVNPSLTCDEAIDILYSTARDLTKGDHMGIGWDEGSGYGEINAAEAVAAALDPTSISHCSITVPNATYTGEPIKPNVQITDTGRTLVEGVDYEVTAEGSRIDAGTYSLTIVGKQGSAYTGEAIATFTIEKAPLTQANLALGTKKLTYNGSKQYAKDSLIAFDIGQNSSTKLVVGEGGDITVTDPGVTLGTGTVTITATPTCKNFTGTATLNYIVGSKNIDELDISVPSALYAGKAIKPNVQIVDNSETLVEGTDYEMMIEGDCVDAGTYYLTITGEGVYAGETTATFTVEKAPLMQANLKLGTTTLTYNGSKQYAKSSLTAFDIGLNASTELANGENGDFTVKDSGAKLGTGSVKLTATSTCKNFTGTATLNYTVSMKKVQVYALYSKKTKQWFYTTSDKERSSKLAAGWTNKGKAWKVPSESTKPVWRLYNKKTGAYRYTTSKSTRTKLEKSGWKYQKIAWYADDYYKTKRVYAQYKKSTGTWRYTTKKTLSGFVNKGTAFYRL